MFVPTSRLLMWVALLVLPFATLAGVVSGAAPLAIGAVALFVAVVLLDLALGFGRLDAIKVESPGVIRMSKDRLGDIELQITNERARSCSLRLGLPLPAELHSEDEELKATLPEGVEKSRVRWGCMPLKRGNYILNKCYMETPSPLGLWALRGTSPIHSEIKVYPNLMSDRKNVAALFLNRGHFGVHALRQVGRGRDFEKLREYVAGDSYDEIHWKGTAKRGKPITKVFQVERTQEVYVIIDASRLSARRFSKDGDLELGQGSNNILERYITAGLILGLAAEQQGDLFGLLTFSNKVQTFVRAKAGKEHYAACRDALYTLHAESVSPDFDELGTFIRLRLRRRALLVFLTSLDDPVLAESFIRNMELICRQHLVLVNMMQPPQARPIFTDANVGSIEDVYRQLGGHLLWHDLRELEKTVQRRGAQFGLLENEKLSAQLVSQYLNIKRRQLL